MLLQEESPPAGNCKRHTAHGVTCQSVTFGEGWYPSISQGVFQSCPGRGGIPSPVLSWGMPPPAWDWGTSLPLGTGVPTPSHLGLGYPSAWDWDIPMSLPPQPTHPRRMHLIIQMRYSLHTGEDKRKLQSKPTHSTWDELYIEPSRLVWFIQWQYVRPSELIKLDRQEHRNSFKPCAAFNLPQTPHYEHRVYHSLSYFEVETKSLSSSCFELETKM